MIRTFLLACLGTPYGWWMYGWGIAAGYGLARYVTAVGRRTP